MLPLNGWMSDGHAALRDHQVTRLRLFDLDVGPRRIEVVVVRDDLAGFQDRVEQDAFGGTPLVRRDDVLEAGQVAHDARRSGRTSGCPRTTRRPASGRPTGPTTSRRSPSRSAGRSARPRRAARTRCSPPLASAASRSSRVVNLSGFDRLDAERFDDGFVVHGLVGGRASIIPHSRDGRRFGSCRATPAPIN